MTLFKGQRSKNPVVTKDDKEDPVLWHLGYKLGLYWVLKSKGKIRREKHHYYYYPILLDLTISFLPFPRIFLKNCFFSLTFNQVKMTSLCLLSHFLYILQFAFELKCLNCILASVTLYYIPITSVPQYIAF